MTENEMRKELTEQMLNVKAECPSTICEEWEGERR